MSYSNELKKATDHLRKSDPVLSNIIKDVGPCTIILKTDYFQSLISSIVSQQISTKAASTIHGRFMDLIDHKLQPDEVLKYDAQQLKSAGLSTQKTNYILDLSEKFSKNPDVYNHLELLNDYEAIDYLTQVKGIGEWTAHMFLMFSLGRLDVLPYADIGLQNALVTHYNLADKPTKKATEQISESWKPYRTVAVWYLWAIYDL